MRTGPLMLAREWRPPWPVDVGRILSPHRRGTGDPAFRITADGAVWRASTTPDGPGTISVRPDPATGTVVATAWGAGAGWLLDGLPEALGVSDDPSAFRPDHPLLREAVTRCPGLRIGRTRRVFEALVPAVLEQKVVGTEAWRAWRHLLRRFGEPAPGAPEMRVPPPPEVWARIPSWEWHRSGAEAVRARTIMQAARVAGRLEALADGGGAGGADGGAGTGGADGGAGTGRADDADGMSSADADARLRSLPGIGVWTSAEIRQRALGDADAVSVGDYHLPTLVGWSLAGRKVDDAGMLVLLEPYAGHRHRVTRLLESAGSYPARRGPRMPVRDYRPF